LHRAVQALTDEPEKGTSERSRENAYDERYCFIQITCNMDERPDMERKYMNSDKAE